MRPSYVLSNEQRQDRIVRRNNRERRSERAEAERDATEKETR